MSSLEPIGKAVCYYLDYTKGVTETSAALKKSKKLIQQC